MKTKPQEAKKTAKTLKGQLFGALSMMLVASIALGTSTYAWFINNRTVEVQQMDLTVSTSTSMLVAVGKKASVATPETEANWTGYKSVITNVDITGKGAASGADVANWNNEKTDAAYQDLLSLQMEPASISTRGLLKPVTAVDANKLTFFLTNNHVASSLLDEFEPKYVGTNDTDVGMGPVKRIPLKFSASSDLDVYFGQKDLANLANMVVESKVAGEVGGKTLSEQAAAIRTALRVAIVPHTDLSDYTTTVTPIILQFNDGSPNDANNKGNNTDYSLITTNAQIFPSVADDTAANTGDVVNNLKGLQDETAGKYAAIKSVNADKHIDTVAIQQATLPTAAGTGYLATVTTNGNSAEVTAPTTTASTLFQLKAGKPRQVDIYFWLEGTDQDCLNAMSGYKFGLNLPFAAVETTP